MLRNLTMKITAAAEDRTGALRFGAFRRFIGIAAGRLPDTLEYRLGLGGRTVVRAIRDLHER